MPKATQWMQRILFVSGIVVVVWIAVTFVYTPIVSVIESAFTRDGSFSLAAANELFGSRRVRQAISNTLIVTAFSIVTVNVVGLFQVAALEYISVRGRAFLKFAYAMPLVFVSVVAATGYKFAYGQNGVVTRSLQSILPSDWFTGTFAVVFAHTFLLTSFHFLFLRAAIRRIDHSLIEAARSLGASNFRAFISVVFPLLLPTIFATTLLVAYKSLGSFAVPSVLGGHRYDMVTELILTLNSLRRPDMAAVLSIGLGIAVILCIVMMQRIEKRGSYSGGGKTPTPIQRIEIGNPVARTVVHILAYALALLQVGPVVMVVLFSFAPAKSIVTDMLPSSLSLKNYITVLSGGEAFFPLRNSLVMGAAAVAAAIAVSLFVVVLDHKYRSKLTSGLDISFMLPWILPAPFIAIGLIIAFGTPNALIGGFTLLGSFWILPAGYAILAIPLSIRFLRAAFWSLDPTQLEAARSLGAPPLYRFIRVTLPAVIPVIVLVAGLQLNGVLSEYSMSAFLFNVNNKPLSIALFDGARSPNPEQAAINLVYMTIIMAFSYVVIALADRFGLGSENARR